MRHPRETPEGWLGLCRCGRERGAGNTFCSLCTERGKELDRRISGIRECMVCGINSTADLCTFCTQEMRSGEHQWQKRNRRAA